MEQLELFALEGELFAVVDQAPAELVDERPAPVPPVERPFRYYLGGRPNWLNDDWSGVPLMISAVTLARYKTRGEAFPVQRWGNWFGDSSAFTALTGANTANHPWHLDPDDFGGMWTRFIEDVGMPDFVSPQDMPCEPVALAATGLTVRDHIEFTVENFLYLRENFPFLPWVPVIQGWEPEDYLYCADLYERHGVDLAAEHLVGIGSICRRASVPGIVRVIETFAGRGYKMHGFGVKVSALPIIGHLLVSADSYGWSDTARKERILLDGCEHLSKPDPVTGEREVTDCRNCKKWAVAWREQVLAAVEQARTGRARPCVPAPRVTRRRMNRYRATA